jgi:hypothetical protein
MRIALFSENFYRFQLAFERAKNHKRKTGITINPRKGCWVNYQLRLAGITQAAVAQRAGCNNRTVSDFLRGRKNSERVRKALADALGYESFEQLLAASRGHDGGEA